MYEAVGRVALNDLADVVFALGAWPYERHVADQHVPELRKFVKTVFAQKMPEPGYAGVVLAGECRPGVLGVGAHGAEFVDHERLLVKSYTFLPVEHRAFRIAFHCNGNGCEHGAEHN